MEWMLILVVGAGIWFWAASSRRRPETSLELVATRETPERAIEDKSSDSMSSTHEDQYEVDVGEMTPAGANAWVLNPKSPLPLTLRNAEMTLAKEVRELLCARQYWTNKVPALALLIAQHNLRFDEVDGFVGRYKPEFDAEVGRHVAMSTEWLSASERDREDLRAEFEAKALDSLGVWTGRIDLASLLEGEPVAFTDDDELLRRFEGDAALYSFYLSSLSRKSSIATVKVEDYGRKYWERLVELGFARRGREIPIPLMLEGLRLKDLNAVLSEVIPKPIGRKAKAIEAALGIPDITERLSNHVSYREMFQVLRPADLNVDGVVKSFAYATDLATIAQQTFYTGVRTLEAIEERRREAGSYDAWEISNWEVPLPSCAAAVCRKYDRLPAKRPPFHVGCSCLLECSFKD